MSTHPLRPDPRRLWLYRHRLAVRALCLLGLATGLLVAVLRYAAGESLVAVDVALLVGVSCTGPLVVLSARSARMHEQRSDGGTSEQ